PRMSSWPPSPRGRQEPPPISSSARTATGRRNGCRAPPAGQAMRRGLVNAEPASPGPGRVGAGAPVPRRAAAWAWDAMSTVGEELDGGLVRLPYTQAELSARFGWPRNDGRVAAYLRALGPVVVSRRGGVVLDP